MFDYHIHSNFSSDCDFSMEEMISGAISNKLQEICITDHVDYDYKDDSIDFDINFEDFDNIFYKLQSKFSDEIILKKGVEIGIQPHVINKCTKLTNSTKFDFVICSIHTCDQLDLYRGDFFKNRSPQDAWSKYLEEAIYCAENFDNFSVFGHLDILKRYNDDAAQIDLTTLKNEFDKLFSILVSKNKGIEVNTSGFKNAFKQPLPSFEIVKWYKDAGGKILTLGSDSHFPENTGFYFDKTISTLKNIGFDKICTFENMNPIFHNI